MTQSQSWSECPFNECYEADKDGELFGVRGDIMHGLKVALDRENGDSEECEWRTRDNVRCKMRAQWIWMTCGWRKRFCTEHVQAARRGGSFARIEDE